MTHALQSAEFWTGVAFCGVFLGMLWPLGRYLKRWGLFQADRVLAEQRAADQVLAEAEALKTQYESAYQKRQAERQKMILEAEADIAFLATEAQKRLADRKMRQTQEVQLRLKIIEENGHRDIQRKLVEHLMTTVNQRFRQRQAAGSIVENPDELVTHACHTLDAWADALRQ